MTFQIAQDVFNYHIVLFEGNDNLLKVKLTLQVSHLLNPFPSPGLFFAEEVPQEGTTDSRFSVKCRWYRSVITKTGQVSNFL